MIIAVIPARGCSKRIPQKNTREFLGRPLISYTINAAAEAKIFDRIIVSTDSESIAKAAIDAGAEIPFMRPSYLSDDITPTIPVLLHALEWLLSRGVKIEYFCLMYSNPFTNSKNILEAFELLI
jgi:pseudaminic acid cytidylyltransferase